MPTSCFDFAYFRRLPIFLVIPRLIPKLRPYSVSEHRSPFTVSLFPVRSLCSALKESSEGLSRHHEKSKQMYGILAEYGTGAQPTHSQEGGVERIFRIMPTSGEWVPPLSPTVPYLMLSHLTSHDKPVLFSILFMYACITTRVCIIYRLSSVMKFCGP
jgi:hypothetical protein